VVPQILQKMEKIEFAHANGFPAESYACLFANMPDFQFSYVNTYGHGKFSAENSWWPLVHELIAHIEQTHIEPVIGIGHSLGAYLFFFAAQKRPELFKRIILLDPPMFPFHKRAVIALLVKLKLINKIPHPANKAKVRKNSFANVDEARKYFKGKALFKNFNEECFEQYLQFGLKPVDGAYGLTFDRAVEYQIFKSMPLWLGKMPEGVPIDYIFSGNWEVLSEGEIKTLMNRFPAIRFHQFDGGHLFPLEKPGATAQLIQNIIRS